MAVQFENFYEDTLSAPITSTDTYIPLTNPPVIATEGWLLLDYDDPDKREFIYYTSKDSGGVTLSSVAGRGKDNTTAIAHLKNAKVRMNLSAGMIESIRDGSALGANSLATAMYQNESVTKAKLEKPHYATVAFNSYGSSGGQVVATTTATLSFSTTIESNGLTPSGGTITIARDGLYKMSCCILMDNGGVGAASLRIRLNGADAAVNSMPDMQANRGVSVETTAFLTAGTTVTAAVANSANQRYAAAGASTQRTCSLSVAEIR